MLITTKMIQSGQYRKLSKIQKAILLILAVHSNQNGENACPSIGTIAAETGYEKKSIILATQELEKVNMINIEKVSGKSNKYSISDQWKQFLPVEVDTTSKPVEVDSTSGSSFPRPVEATSTRTENNRVIKDNMSSSSQKSNDTSQIKEIVGYLNLKCNTNYRCNTKSTVSHINARLREGFYIDDFQKVIDHKSAEWLKDSKMSQFLRPETLFGNKFEGYLQAAGKTESINQTPVRKKELVF